MQRSLKALPLMLIAGAAIFPGVASAKDIQIGVTKSPVVAPVCPSGVSQSNCKIVLTKVTALESRRDNVSYPTTITTPGVISSFTVGVSGLSSNKTTVKQDVSYLDSTYGGPPQVQLTVLRPVGKPSADNWRVAAKSPVFPVKSYLGRVVELPLIDALPVTKGEALALTVPTWAPVLSFDLAAKQFSYQQSLDHACKSISTSNANVQSMIGEFANYGCTYRGTRVEYSALEVTGP